MFSCSGDEPLFAIIMRRISVGAINGISLSHLPISLHSFDKVFLCFWHLYLTFFFLFFHRQGWQESCRGSETKVWGREAIQRGLNAWDVHPDEREGAGKIPHWVSSNLLTYMGVFGLWFSGVFANTVSIGFCDHPPSEGLRSLNPEWSLKQESGYSDQVVAKSRVWAYRPGSR